jgi:hypothetical protein
MLIRMFCTVKENGVCRISTGQKLMNLYRERDIISEMRNRRLRWLGHVERMPEERAMKMFKNTPEGRRSVKKPRNLWFDDVENGLKKMSVAGWRKVVKGRDDWKLTLKESRVLHGP